MVTVLFLIFMALWAISVLYMYIRTNYTKGGSIWLNFSRQADYLAYAIISIVFVAPVYAIWLAWSTYG